MAEHIIDFIDQVQVPVRGARIAVGSHSSGRAFDPRVMMALHPNGDIVFPTQVFIFAADEARALRDALTTALDAIPTDLRAFTLDVAEAGA